MNNQQVIIRDCEKEDLIHLKKIRKEFVDYHVSVDENFKKVENHEKLFEHFVKDNLSDNDSKIFVASYNEGIVAYIFGKIEEKPPLYPETTYGYVDSLSVLEEFQRKGIGEKLVHELLSWFKTKNVNRIEIQAAIKNPKSMSFWKKMDFIPFMEAMYYKID